MNLDHLEDLDVDDNIILTWVLRECIYEPESWIHLVHYRVYILVY
jgi:hypothetical protein